MLRRDKWEIGIAVCSFVVCLVSMAVMLAVDPRESVSRSERRRLAEKPELTWAGSLSIPGRSAAHQGVLCL